MSDRYGPRLIATSGFILLTPFLILLRLPQKDGLGEIVLFCALVSLVGAALALILAPVLAEVTLVVRDLEDEKPGRFGANGAYAQAVCFSRYGHGNETVDLVVNVLLAGV